MANRKLRIAVWHNLPSGGGKRALYNHVKGLVERGHHVEAWSPETANQQYMPIGALVKEHVLPLHANRGDFNNVARKVGIVRKLLHAMEMHTQACAQQINAGGFDLVFANTCQYFRTSPIARYVSAPAVLYLQEPYRWFYEALPRLAWLAPPETANSLFYELARRLYGRPTSDGVQLQANKEIEYAMGFDRVLVNSAYSRESVLRAYNVEARVCYLGIDTEHFRAPTAEKSAYVVGLGTISHAKGVDRAIRAIASVDRAVRPKLVWIGNDATDSDLRDYTQLANRSEVSFEPRMNVTDVELIETLSRAAAMIYTSRLEPFGLAPLEANACGTAVVAIAEGGVKETMRDGVTGYVAPDDDPAVLGRHIHALVGDLELARALGTSAREHVQRHWDISLGTDALERALEAVL